jgi:hypothetical protein
LDKSPKHRSSHWLDFLGFLLPVIFPFLVNSTVFTKVYIFNIAFPKAMLAFMCILGACLFSIGCLRYKRKDKGILPNYAGFGFWLFIGSFAGLFILVSIVTAYY